MAAQEANRLQWKRRSILSGKLRIFILILCLLCALALTFFWIRGVNNDQLNKIMTALTTMFMLVCAFLGLPILKPSEQDDTPATAPVSQAQAPLNPPFNQFPYPVPGTGQTIYMVEGDMVVNNMSGGQATTTNNNAPLQQQADPGNAPGVNEAPSSVSSVAPSGSFAGNDPMLRVAPGGKNEADVSDTSAPRSAQMTRLTLLKSHPAISDHPSVDELLDLAKWLISQAQAQIQEVRQPFARRGSIALTRFNPAIERLNEAKRHLDELVDLLPAMLALTHEQILSKAQAGSWEIKKKVHTAKTDADTLISLLKERQPSDRQEITRQCDELATKILELASFYER